MRLNTIVVLFYIVLLVSGPCLSEAQIGIVRGIKSIRLFRVKPVYPKIPPKRVPRYPAKKPHFGFDDLNKYPMKVRPKHFQNSSNNMGFFHKPNNTVVYPDNGFQDYQQLMLKSRKNNNPYNNSRLRERMNNKVNIDRLDVIHGNIEPTAKQITRNNLDRLQKEVIVGFQRKHGLRETGFFDYDTYKKLIEVENKIIYDLTLLNEVQNLENPSLKNILGAYQKKKGIEVTGVYDQNTILEIKKQKVKIENSLKKVFPASGDMPFENQVLLYKTINKLENQNLIVDNELLNAIKTDNNIYLNIDGGIQAFEKSALRIYGQEEKLYKNLDAIKLSDDARVYLVAGDDIKKSIKEVNQKLNWDYNFDEITILPLTDNSDTRKLLRADFNAQWIKRQFKNEEKLEKWLAREKRKTIMVVGHVEKGKYVNGDFSISIDRLNQLAKENNFNIFHLGCSTAQFAGTGTNASINTHHTVNALLKEVKRHSNFKEFLMDFSNKGIGTEKAKIDLVIDANTFTNKAYTQIKVYKNLGVTAGTVGGGIVAGYIINRLEQDK